MGLHRLLPSSSSSPKHTFEKNSPIISSMSSSIDYELVRDQLVTILVKEKSASYQVAERIKCQASSKHSPGRNHGDELSGGSPACEEWRRKICQWSFRVVDHFRLDREVVSCGLNIFDRFIATSSPPPQIHRQGGQVKSGDCPCPSCTRSIDSRTYQLAAMASLYIAIKMRPQDGMNEEGGARRKRFFRLQSFVELSRGQFCATDICEMELTILKKLQWKVNPPTPMALVSYLLCLMPPHDSMPAGARNSYDLVLHVLQELARYLTELSVCVGGVCSRSPASQVAFASILVSMELLTNKALPLQVRNVFNQTVSTLSCISGGTSLTHNGDGVREIKKCLQRSLLPEMLVDNDYEKAGPAGDSCHPISMARDFGLLDLSRIHGYSTSTNKNSNVSNNKGGHNEKGSSSKMSRHTSSPTSVKRFVVSSHDSPVSISRG